MKLLSCVTLQRSPTFSFLWVVQSLPASGSDQQQLYEYGTSCDPIKACHVIYVSIIDYSSDSVSVIWCHVIGCCCIRIQLYGTAAPKDDLQYQIQYHLRVGMWEHATCTAQGLVFWWHHIGIQLYDMFLLPCYAIITYNKKDDFIKGKLDGALLVSWSADHLDYCDWDYRFDHEAIQ